MKSYKQLVESLNTLNVTNGDITKIQKATKKKIAELRSSKTKADIDDADYLQYSFMDALNKRNLANISRTMKGGETETREIMFKLVSDVIGKQQAQKL